MRVKPDSVADSSSQSGGGSPFKTTRWSLILSSLDGNTDEKKAREALAQLCRTYWRPIFAFICRRGYSTEDAQDLTQDFFLMVLNGNLLQRADRDRGRFRSLLLKALQNFLIDAHEKRSAQKRGGEIHFVSWDDWMAEAPSQLSLPLDALKHWTAEKIYDVRWAATVAERALARLAEECESRGRRRAFDALSGQLTLDRTEVSYGALGRELGIAENAVKRLLHHLRLRFRELLRAEVARTIANPADVDDELRHLCAALAAGTDFTC